MNSPPVLAYYNTQPSYLLILNQYFPRSKFPWLQKYQFLKKLDNAPIHQVCSIKFLHTDTLGQVIQFMFNYL